MPSVPDVQNWTITQLHMRSAWLSGRVAAYESDLQHLAAQLQKTVDDISALEALRRNIDIADEQDTLDHLRQREFAIRKEIRSFREEMDELGRPLKLQIRGATQSRVTRTTRHMAPVTHKH